MISGIEKSTSSSVNEEIKDIIMSSYTQDELFQALLFSDLLEEVLPQSMSRHWKTAPLK